MAVSSKNKSTKLVRNPNTPSLKSQGAGYSTTNRKGETTFYKSSKDAPGYNDTTQSRTDMSKGNAPISTFNAGGKAITPDAMNKVPVLTTPTPTITDPGNVAGAGNNQIANILSGVGFTQDNKGMIVPPPAGSAEEATTTANATMAQQLQSLLGVKKQDESQVDIYNNLAEKRALERAQREELAVANQLNSVTAERDAAQLSLEGQGRGQTGGFIGGEQARINREAAIKALPLQAQLSAAQGNREFAQQQLNTMFSLKVADSQAKTKFWNGLVDSAIGFATTAQQNVLNAKLADINTKSQKEQANLGLMNQWAQMAVETGQSGLISQFTALDPKSPTFTADLGRLQGQVRKPVAAGGDGAPKVVSINGVDSIWNPQTGQFEQASVGGASTLKPVKDAEIKDLNDTWTAKNSIVSIIDDMTSSISDNGTKIFWGSEAGKRGANKTNLLLAMKNLEKTGALDKGTIDVLADLIPENEFWATEDRQVSSLNQLKDTIVGKIDEFVGSYRGTTAEVDPRTKRIYGTVDISTLPQNDIAEIYNLFGVSQSTSSGAFNADDWLK